MNFSLLSLRRVLLAVFLLASITPRLAQAADPGPVAAAVLADDIMALRAALAAGGSADAADAVIDRRPVHLIAAPGGTRNPEMLEALARGGADLNAIDPFTGLTPLAASMIVPDGDGAQGIVELARSLSLTAQLLRLGADPNRALARGETPLMIAVALDNLPAAKLLLEHGARTDARDSSGATALHRARALQRPPEMIAALIGAGASPAARDAEGNTPEQAAERVVAARMSGGITARRVTIDGAPAAADAPVDDDAARLEDGADRTSDTGGSSLRKWLIGGAAVAAAVAGTVVLAALVQNQKKRRAQGAQAAAPSASAAPAAAAPVPVTAAPVAAITPAVIPAITPAPIAAPVASAPPSAPPAPAIAPTIAPTIAPAINPPAAAATPGPSSPSPPVVTAPATPAKPAAADPTRVTIQPFRPAQAPVALAPTPSPQPAPALAPAPVAAAAATPITAPNAAPVAAPAASTPTPAKPAAVVAAVVATPAPAPASTPAPLPANAPVTSTAPVSAPAVSPVASAPVTSTTLTPAPVASAPVSGTPVTGVIQAISALAPATTTTKPPASPATAPATAVPPVSATPAPQPAPQPAPAPAAALVVAPSTGAGNSNDREIAIDRIDVTPAAPYAGQDLRVDVALRNRSGYQLDRALWRLIDTATGRILFEESLRLASRATVNRSAPVSGRAAGKASLAVMTIPGQPTAPPQPAPAAGSRPGTTVQVSYVFNPGNEVIGRREFSVSIAATPVAPPKPVAQPAPPPVPPVPASPVCTPPKAPIGGVCETDARSFPKAPFFPGCSVSGQIVREIPKGPCAQLEYDVERFKAGCLTRADGNISARIRAWHQCLVDNSSGGFRTQYQRDLDNYNATNTACAPGFAVDGRCIEFPSCGMGSIGGMVCSCSRGKVVGSNGLCVSQPVCVPPQTLQNNVCVTPPPKPAPAPAPGAGGGSDGSSGGGSSGGGSSGGGSGGGTSGGGGSSGGGTTTPGGAGIQALMFCWQNKNGYWFCDGKGQFTDIGEKGDEGLSENMGLAGCKSPALIGPITLESTSSRVSGTRSGILFRCADRLTGEANTRDQGHLTWNRNIRLFWRDLSRF